MLKEEWALFQGKAASLRHFFQSPVAVAILKWSHEPSFNAQGHAFYSAPSRLSSCCVDWSESWTVTGSLSICLTEITWIFMTFIWYVTLSVAAFWSKALDQPFIMLQLFLWSMKRSFGNWVYWVQTLQECYKIRSFMLAFILFLEVEKNSTVWREANLFAFLLILSCTMIRPIMSMLRMDRRTDKEGLIKYSVRKK